MSTVNHNSENLQELLDRLERDRREAALSGNKSRYTSALAIEVFELRQILTVAAEQSKLFENGVNDVPEEVYGRARYFELDGK